jgi:hypothetical protein
MVAGAWTLPHPNVGRTFRGLRVKLPPSLKLRRTAVALAEAGRRTAIALAKAVRSARREGTAFVLSVSKDEHPRPDGSFAIERPQLNAEGCG